jgi:hypothetical protein
MERAAHAWVRGHVGPTGTAVLASDAPWARVWRVPIAGGTVWFKHCAPVQAFEPRLTAALFDRWPDRITEVIAYDVDRHWLLLADAGRQLRDRRNPPEVWLDLLPRYSELQRGEATRASEHVAHGVPDLRVETLPARYEDRLLRPQLPIGDTDRDRLRQFAPRFARLCDELAEAAIPASVQHDDLHASNISLAGEHVRIIDWGDASISCPFASLVVTFRFLEETNGLAPDDPWFARLRDAYIEPWGPGLAETFGLALTVGSFAHAIAWTRQRDALPSAARTKFDEAFFTILQRALRYV